MMRSKKAASTTMPPDAPDAEASVTAGDAVTLPRPARRTSVRESSAPHPRATGKVQPKSAGRSNGPGAAFAAWLRTQGIDPDQRLPTQQFEELLAQFGARPVHGHRRRGPGDNHRPNPEALRK